MTLKITCPKCSRQYDVDDSVIGMYVDCPSCNNRFRAQAAAGMSGPGNRLNALPKRLSMTEALVLMSITWGLLLLWPILELSVTEPLFMFVLLVFGILTIIYSCLLHYKCWTALPERFARMTPGKAVGYLFIPAFGLYWGFQSFGGLGADCVALAHAKGWKEHDHLVGLGYALAGTNCTPPVLGFIGEPLLASAAFIASFVLWILFYRGVTGFLNRVAMEESSSPSAE